MTRLACTCGKEYSVKDRSPGTRVRCRACNAVLVVPEPRQSPAVRSASDRLKASRGEACREHPKKVADRTCAGCSRRMCSLCEARLADHLCLACAAKTGVTKPFAAGLGPVATPLLAAKALVRAFPRLLVLNILLHAAWIASLVVILVGAYVLAGGVPDQKAAPGSFLAFWWPVLGIATIVLMGLASFLVGVVLIPAADFHVIDGVLRNEERSFAHDLSGALRRSWERKWALLWTYAMLLGAGLPPFLAFVPFGLGYFLLDSPRSLALGILLGFPMLGASLAAFGLALPAVILEHRSGVSALARAWELVRRRLVLVGGLGAAFMIAFIAAAVFLEQVRIGFAGSQTGVGHFLDRVSGGLGMLAFDLSWPALLTALYHGLVAEDEGVA